MIFERDEPADMRRFPLDDRTANRLLAGELLPEDAPAGFEEVARLVAAAAAPPVGAELGSAAAMVGVIAGAMATAPHVTIASRRNPVRSRITAKVAGLAAAAVLLTGTAAAAATNSLPASAQSAVADAASTVGVNIPKHHHHGNPHDAALTAAGTAAPDTGEGKPAKTGTGHGKGPDAGPTSPATYGLCQAFSKVTTADPRSHSTAYRNLAAAAATAHQTVSAYCATIKPPAGDVSGTEDQNSSTTEAPEAPEAPDAGKANGHAAIPGPNEAPSTSTSTTTGHGAPANPGKPTTTGH